MWPAWTCLLLPALGGLWRPAGALRVGRDPVGLPEKPHAGLPEPERPHASSPKSSSGSFPGQRARRCPSSSRVVKLAYQDEDEVIDDAEVGVEVDGKHLCNKNIILNSGPSKRRVEKMFGSKYPIKPEMHERAEFLGDWTRLKQFLLKVSKRARPVSVGIVGGSYTFGVGVEPTDTWAARLVDHIKGWGKINVVNQARRGRDTLQWLHDEKVWEQWRYATPDLLILELAVNDQVYGSEKPMKELYQVFGTMVKRLLSLPGPPALLFAEAFRAANGTSSSDEVNMHCPKKWANHTSFASGLAGKHYYWCSHWWQTATVHQRILRKYGLPYFSYRDLVWPEFGKPPENLNEFWKGNSHPDWVTHQLFADGIAHMLARCNAELCTPGLPLPENRTETVAIDDIEKLGFCTTPLQTIMSPMDGFPAVGVEAIPRIVRRHANLTAIVEDPATLREKRWMSRGKLPEPVSAWEWVVERNVTKGLWRFGEDVKGKPGWQLNPTAWDVKTHQAEDLHISFALKIGSSGLISLEYLQSYHNMGQVAVWLDDHEDEQQTIEAFSSDCYSVSTSLVIPAEQGNRTLHMKLLPRKDIDVSHDPYQILPGNKFKLIAITTC